MNPSPSSHGAGTTPEIPRIISVDDHVVEPPDLWTSRLPAKYQDVCPRVERDRALPVVGRTLGSMDTQKGHPDGQWADFWRYEGKVNMLPFSSVAYGRQGLDFTPITFDEIDPACWQQGPRLEAMDRNHVEASICFPNILPRFCGQTFLEASDKELALLCVQAYNDWMIDEWCAGDAHGRLIPLTLVPLWDVQLAVAEVERCAARGSHAITFCEAPYHLGLPSVHDVDRYWDPLFAACEETQTVINMHIGSSSQMPRTSPDAPMFVSSTLTFMNALGSMVDFLISGTFVRFPELHIAYSESQAGWAPYVLERADKLWEQRKAGTFFGSDLPERPSSYFADHIWLCIFEDETALETRDRIGMGQLTFEVDYPHLDTTYPHTKKVAEEIAAAAGLDEHETWQLFRGNAIRAYGLERWGITS